MQNVNDPRKTNNNAAPLPRHDLPMHATAKHNGDDESLESSSPNDTRSDEKVIVNEQRGNKTVNEPSQTAPNTSEDISSDEEIVNQP